MRVLFVCIFLFVSFCGASTVSAKVTKPKPLCPTGYNYIILQSAPQGYTCIGENSYMSLGYTIADYKRRIDSGEDTTVLLREIREYMKNSESYASDENRAFYPIILDRIKSYSNILCRANNNNPVVNIATAGIYDGDILTPTCLLSGKARRTQTGSMRMILSFAGIGEQQIRYTQTGASFAGLHIDKQGTGKHTITCEYRPNVCIAPRIDKRVIDVGGVVTSIVKPGIKSIARVWNEIILSAIRKDRVRPPVQARNLFHFGAMNYDIWALYHPGNQTYLFDNSAMGVCLRPHAQISSQNPDADIERAISYASYRLIAHRYHESPGYTDTMSRADALMNRLGYDVRNSKLDISKKVTPAELGNAIADCYIRYGKKDGSNEEGKTTIAGEAGSYSNQYYTPINPPLAMNSTGGNTSIIDWNRWQPLSVDVFIDQAGNPIPGGAATFIGAEWGNVHPFSLRADQQTIHERDGNKYISYLDPGLPPQATGSTLDLWRWNYELVALWSSHLDARDTTQIDISPAHMGTTGILPTTFSGMLDFYDMQGGGTETTGHTTNPRTGTPYAQHIVKRGDYARVIAEFWADGPTSETPPGHWFTILNTTSDNLTSKRWAGQGPVLSDLEWDIRSYFTLGGSLHDAGIAAWGSKGAYDEIRPVSAIRAMATAGQSSDPILPHYSPMGLDLIPGYIELIGTGDTLEGKNGVNRGKIKLRAWKGPKYINDPSIDSAGTDWILAENWWPYQRSSFVTPPFSGYVSGHSTFSRAAAETLTAITGDEYFPGGLMTWYMRRNNYLFFEQGPSTDITLEWATYRDAADESALSRIWGGIHPPMDDIPGRIMGEQIGKQAYEYANRYFRK